MSHRIRVHDGCIGIGVCQSTAPNLFTLDGDRSVPLVDSVGDEDIAAAREAADACPMQAIEIS